MIPAAKSRWVDKHPGVVVLHLLMHGFLVFLWDNPLLLCGQLLFLLLWGMQEKLFHPFPAILRFGWWISFATLLVNPLFGQNGETFLWRGPIIPLIGRLDLTMEELGYAVIVMLRLIILLLLSVMYQRFVNHDRFLLQFARVAPRFVLTSVLAIRLIPVLTVELNRIREITLLRGLQPDHPSPKEKLMAHMKLFRPLLLSALEGSWLTAETMYARGFGSGPRSIYKQENMTEQEKIGFLFILLLFAFILFARYNGYGNFAFFPRLSWADPYGDILFLIILYPLWAVPVYWLARRQEN